MTAAIDIHHLELYVGGDVALRDEILGIFAEQAEIWVSRLDPSLSDEQWYDASHALKGASKGVGAWSVGELCETAEGLIGDRENKLASRHALLQEITREVAAALSEARRYRNA